MVSFTSTMTYIETYTTSSNDYAYSEDDFDGSNAAPLLIVGQEAKKILVDSQDALAHNFVELAHSELSSFVKPSIVTFVARSVVSRMHQREGLNGVSYNQRLFKGFPDATASEACEKAKYGRGTPIENEIARHAFGMKSVEYANLTIIGDARKNLEPKMWDQVGELFDIDATPKPDQMYGLQVLGFDRDIRTSSHIGAMRIGMKRYLGETKLGAIGKARTTAIVNLSPSTGFDSNLVDLFRETAIKGNNIADLPEFQSAVKWLVETELPSGLVLARNETVYGAVHSKDLKTN